MLSYSRHDTGGKPDMNSSYVVSKDDYEIGTVSLSTSSGLWTHDKADDDSPGYERRRDAAQALYHKHTAQVLLDMGKAREPRP